jgi:hypothetical protein
LTMEQMMKYFEKIVLKLFFHNSLKYAENFLYK